MVLMEATNDASKSTSESVVPSAPVLLIIDRQLIVAIGTLSETTSIAKPIPSAILACAEAEKPSAKVTAWATGFNPKKDDSVTKAGS